MLSVMLGVPTHTDASSKTRPARTAVSVPTVCFRTPLNVHEIKVLAESQLVGLEFAEVRDLSLSKYPLSSRPES